MIEQAPRSASAPVAAVPVIMRVSGIAIVMGAVAEMPSVVMASMVVISAVVVWEVVSMSVVHVVSFDAV